MKLWLLMSMHEWGQHWKLVLASVFAAVAAGANIIAQALPAPDEAKVFWDKAEDLGLKGALLGAVVILWRVWQSDRKEHKSQMETVVKANTASNDAVVATMNRQVHYFDQLNSKLVDRAITDHGRDRA